MAQYGRIRIVVQDSTGIPISGATVEVRKQGATVNGLHNGATTSFTVNDPGALLAADEVQVGTDSSITRSVSSVAATNVTVGGPGFTDVANDARLTCSNNLPTLYSDAQGAETKTNGMTTNSLGVAECWAQVRPFDIRVSGSGITTYLLQDVVPVGNERLISNVYGTGTATAFSLDTARTLAAGDKLLDVAENGTSRVYVEQDGTLVVVAGGASVTGNSTITGTLTTSGALTVSSGGIAATGNSTITGTLGGVTSLTMSGALATPTTITASSDITGRDLINRRIASTAGTSLVVGDFALSAGWGTTATVASTIGRDTIGEVRISSSGTGQSANPTVTLTFKDGTFGNCIAIVSNGPNFTTPASSDFWYSNAGGASISFAYGGTPVAGRTYELYWFTVKRT